MTWQTTAATTIVGFVALMAGTSPAGAHTGRLKQVDLTMSDASVHARVVVPALEAAITLGLGADVAPARLSAAAGPLADQLATQLMMAANGQACGVRRQQIRATADHLTVVLVYRCPSAMGLTFADAALDGDTNHETHLAVGNGSQRRLVVLRDARAVPLSPLSWPATVAMFVYEGALHLVTGYDHLLFLFTLVLGAGWMSRRQPRMVVFVRAATVVTAFTVGHSVTLVCAALEIISLPATAVEATIALSIVLAAVLNIVRPDAGTGRWALALGFGLIHGFGFSSVLADVGLPSGQRLIALLSFNFGIEIAQLTLVMIALVPLMRLAQRRWYRPAVTIAGSSFAALCGLFWFAERTHLL